MVRSPRGAPGAASEGGRVLDGGEQGDEVLGALDRREEDAERPVAGLDAEGGAHRPGGQRRSGRSGRRRALGQRAPRVGGERRGAEGEVEEGDPDPRAAPSMRSSGRRSPTGLSPGMRWSAPRRKDHGAVNQAWPLG